MPTYEYECRGCGHSFELLQNITAKPITTCPKCHKEEAKRLIGTGSGIIFKGSGFYATDYRKKPKGKESGPSSCPASKDGCAGCPKNPQGH